MRVVARWSESADVVALELEAVDFLPLGVPRAGQYITLKLTPANAAPLLRSYSLTGTPDDRVYRIAVKIEPEGVGGQYLRHQLGIGDAVEVAAPVWRVSRSMRAMVRWHS